MRALLLALLVLLAAPAFAVQPDEMLADPALEARARAISAELRCVVCQNTTIDGSDAPVARDMRLLVRERLVAGDSDAEVLGYLQARYGDFVLFSPPWKPSTYLLWTGPFVLMALAIFGTIFAFRKRRTRSEVAALSPEERAALDRLMRRGDA